VHPLGSEVRFHGSHSEDVVSGAPLGLEVGVHDAPFGARGAALEGGVALRGRDRRLRVPLFGAQGSGCRGLVLGFRIRGLLLRDCCFGVECSVLRDECLVFSV